MLVEYFHGRISFWFFSKKMAKYAKKVLCLQKNHEKKIVLSYLSIKDKIKAKADKKVRSHVWTYY